MAVRGPDRTKVCERCFAVVDAALAACPECGAPLGGDIEQATDTAMYPELARANVLRLRGEYKQAEQICLNILRRYPNNVTAHTLMGDVYSDLGDLENAAQWYELALDLDPSSETDKQKLEAVREQIRARDAGQATNELAVPDHTKSTPALLGLALAIFAVIAIGAFMLGRGTQVAPVVRRPISAPLESAPVTDPASSAHGLGVPGLNPALEDRTTMQTIAQHSPLGARLVSAITDPRTKNLTLTIAVTGSDDDRRIAAELAKTAVDQLTDASVVTVRVVRSDHLDYVADVQREKVLQVETPQWQASAASPDAWITSVLMNEWTPQTPSSEPAASSPPPTSTGTRPQSP